MKPVQNVGTAADLFAVRTSAPSRPTGPARAQPEQQRGSGWYWASGGEIRPGINLGGIGGPKSRQPAGAYKKLKIKLLLLPFRVLLGVGDLVSRIAGPK